MTLLGVYRAANEAFVTRLATEPEYSGLIGVDVWTMIFTFCNLMIVFFFAKKFLLGPVKKMIDDRQKEVDEMYSDAEENRTAAKEMKAEYEAKLEGANEESEQILRSAVRRAQLKEEEILRDANDKAARVMERAEEQIALEKKQALNEVKNEVSEMAIGIAAAVIERDVSEEEHKELIDSFIDGIGDGE